LQFLADRRHAGDGEAVWPRHNNHDATHKRGDDVAKNQRPVSIPEVGQQQRAPGGDDGADHLDPGKQAEAHVPVQQTLGNTAEALRDESGASDDGDQCELGNPEKCSQRMSDRDRDSETSQSKDKADRVQLLQLFVGHLPESENGRGDPDIAEVPEIGENDEGHCSDAEIRRGKQASDEEK
jgi:hypothetical protein